MPRRKEEVIVIEPAVESTTRLNPALGTVERLLKQSMLETQSLKIVHTMIVRETEQRAQLHAPQKILAASQIRNGHRREMGETLPLEAPPAPKRVYNKKFSKKQHNRTRATGLGAARKNEQLAKKQVTGPRLTLFILEHLSENEYRGALWMMNELHKRDEGQHIVGLSGVWGKLTTSGWAVRDEKGYRLTKKGRQRAEQLRDELESTGQCIKNGYLAPIDYSTKRSYTDRFKHPERFEDQPSIN